MIKIIAVFSVFLILSCNQSGNLRNNSDTNNADSLSSPSSFDLGTFPRKWTNLIDDKATEDYKYLSRDDVPEEYLEIGYIDSLQRKRFFNENTFGESFNYFNKFKYSLRIGNVPLGGRFYLIKNFIKISNTTYRLELIDFSGWGTKVKNGYLDIEIISEEKGIAKLKFTNIGLLDTKLLDYYNGFTFVRDENLNLFRKENRVSSTDE